MDTKTLIRIRFNTEHKKTPGLFWRVLVGEGDTPTEHLAEGFTITGTCASTHECLPVVGDKWHVGCVGTLVWEGATAHITADTPQLPYA